MRVLPKSEDPHTQIRKAVYDLRDWARSLGYEIRIDCNLIGRENVDVYRSGEQPVDEKGLGR